MFSRKLSRRQLLKTAGLLGVAGAIFDPAKVLANEGEGSRVTWDIVSVGTGSIRRGGDAAAKAEDGSIITITGHGTFPNVDRCSPVVSGGGTWSIFKPATSTDSRCFSGSGNYRVTELLSWVTAPGGVLPLPDATGDRGTASAGLATLRVRFDDGRRGTLTISCHLPGSPNCMPEGITATMVYEDFFEAQPPTGDHNRTLFHVGGPGDKDD